jgi:hypothetical protein
MFSPVVLPAGLGNMRRRWVAAVAFLLADKVIE